MPRFRVWCFLVHTIEKGGNDFWRSEKNLKLYIKGMLFSSHNYTKKSHKIYPNSAISHTIFPIHATAFLSSGSHEPKPYGLPCHSTSVFRHTFLNYNCKCSSIKIVILIIQRRHAKELYKIEIMKIFNVNWAENFKMKYPDIPSNN